MVYVAVKLSFMVVTTIQTPFPNFQRPVQIISVLPSEEKHFREMTNGTSVALSDFNGVLAVICTLTLKTSNQSLRGQEVVIALIAPTCFFILTFIIPLDCLKKKTTQKTITTIIHIYSEVKEPMQMTYHGLWMTFIHCCE